MQLSLDKRASGSQNLIMFGPRGNSQSFGQSVNFNLSNVNSQLPSQPYTSTGIVPSVSNNSLDLQVDDKVTTLKIPLQSKVGNINFLSPENSFNTGDLVFMLRSRVHDAFCPGEDLKPKHTKINGNHVALATLPFVNEILRLKHKEAEENCDDTCHWFEYPEMVAEWAVPLGFVLNTFKMPSNGSGYVQSAYGNNSGVGAPIGVNICVSRRCNAKNSFALVGGEANPENSSRTTQSLYVSYSVEHYKSTGNSRNFKDLVFVSTLCANNHMVHEMINPRNTRSDKLKMQGNNVLNAEIEKVCATYNQQDENTRPVFLPLGCVLHSPPNMPNATQMISACMHKKASYDRMKNIEIEVGCPTK